MTGNTVPQLVHKLLQAGADRNIPFLVIEQATTPNQFVHQFTLHEFDSSDIHEEFLSPSLVIAGKVATLYKQFAWLPNNNKRENYFKPLENYRELISLINNIQQLSHVSRA
jgi:uroporphyrin-III C-methyltransferase